MNKYVELFEARMKDEEVYLIDVLLYVIQEYNREYIKGWKPTDQCGQLKNDPVEIEILALLESLKDKIDAPVGNIILPYLLPKTGMSQKKILYPKGERPKFELKFSHGEEDAPKDIFPQDFINLINKAKEYEREALIKKRSKYDAPSVLVTQCDNEAAGESFSIETLVKQIIKLENALQAGAIQLSSEKREISNKIVKWIDKLNRKIAEEIVELSNVESLSKSLNKKLVVNYRSLLAERPNAQSQQYQLVAFIKEIEYQFNYLVNTHFFEEYYQKTEPHEKYDYVKAVSLKIQESFGSSCGLYATFNALAQAIMNKAYKSIEAEKHRLMESPTCTVDKLFGTLETWFKEKFELTLDSTLIKILHKKLQDEKEVFETWRDINAHIANLESKEYRTIDPLARDLIPLRYTYALDQDPREILAEFEERLRKKMAEEDSLKTRPLIFNKNKERSHENEKEKENIQNLLFANIPNKKAKNLDSDDGVASVSVDKGSVSKKLKKRA